MHARTLPAAGPVRDDARPLARRSTSRTWPRSTAAGSSTTSARSRCPTACCSKAGALDAAGIARHARAPDHRRRAVRRAPIVQQGPADRPAPPRAARRLGLSRRPAKRQVPLLAQIVGIVDVFDALDERAAVSGGAIARRRVRGAGGRSRGKDGAIARWSTRSSPLTERRRTERAEEGEWRNTGRKRVRKSRRPCTSASAARCDRADRARR